jgi:hypothetical protein
MIDTRRPVRSRTQGADDARNPVVCDSLHLILKEATPAKPSLVVRRKRRSEKPPPSIVFIPFWDGPSRKTPGMCPELCPIDCAPNDGRSDDTTHSRGCT